MVWHYHDDDVAGSDAAVSLSVGGLPVSIANAKLTHHRIDQHHSNAYAEWLRMGSPVAPNEQQYAALEAAIATFLEWRKQFCDDRGELLPKFQPDPMIASFMRDADDPETFARDAIPVPKGPVDTW